MTWAKVDVEMRATVGASEMLGREMTDRYVVRATDYGYGVWDTMAQDWWIPRLDMAKRDAEQIVEDLNESRV
jgi:hypothetical protein